MIKSLFLLLTIIYDEALNPFDTKHRKIIMKLDLDVFKADTLITAGKTIATVALTQITGRLGGFAVSTRFAIMVSAVAGLVSSIARNIFDDSEDEESSVLSKVAYYASIPVGVLAGVGAYRFFYTAGVTTPLVLKTTALFSLIHVSIQLIVDVIEESKNAPTKA